MPKVSKLPKMPKIKDGNHLYKRATNFIINLEPFRCHRPANQQPKARDQSPALRHRNTANFQDIGYPLKYSVDTVLFKGFHPLFNRLFGKVLGGGLFFNQYFYFGCSLHEFMDTHPAFIPRSATPFAARRPK